MQRFVALPPSRLEDRFAAWDALPGAVRAPSVSVRGLVPFHDFNEGPDLWSAANYEAYTAQLAKLGYNQIALHNYNYYEAPYAEPTTWLGPARAVDASGHVRAAYADGTQRVSWHSTCISESGEPAANASLLAFGAAQLWGGACELARWGALGPRNASTEAAGIAAFDDAASWQLERPPPEPPSSSSSLVSLFLSLTTVLPSSSTATLDTLTASPFAHAAFTSHSNRPAMHTP